MKKNFIGIMAAVAVLVLGSCSSSGSDDLDEVLEALEQEDGNEEEEEADSSQDEVSYGQGKLCMLFSVLETLYYGSSEADVTEETSHFAWDISVQSTELMGELYETQSVGVVWEYACDYEDYHTFAFYNNGLKDDREIKVSVNISLLENMEGTASLTFTAYVTYEGETLMHKIWTLVDTSAGSYASCVDVETLETEDWEGTPYVIEFNTAELFGLETTL